MKQIITARLKLHTNPCQVVALRKTQLAYRDVLNSVDQYSFEHGKMSHQHRLQEACYDEVHTCYKLPAQMLFVNCRWMRRSDSP